MRIVVKILLSFVLFILSLIISVLLKVMIAPNDMVFLPSGLVFLVTLIGGLIGIWRYKPNNNSKIENSDNHQNLDKTL